MIRIAAGIALLISAYVMGFTAWRPFGFGSVALSLAAGAAALAFVGHRWKSTADSKIERQREILVQAGKAAAIWVACYSLFWVGLMAGFSVGI